MAATANTSRRVRAFKRWMNSQGFECSDALQITDIPDEGLAVRALFDLREGDVVATIPKLACLTIKTTAASDLIEAASFDGFLGLSVALMYERSLGDLSPWAPYLQLLPHRECLPLVWTLEEVDRLLCGTEIHKVRFLRFPLTLLCLPFLWWPIIFCVGNLCILLDDPFLEIFSLT